MDQQRKPPKIITVASMIGIVLSILALGTPGLEALFILTIIPLLLCMGLLIKKWWICGLLYCVVFLLARYNMFLGKMLLLATILNLSIVSLFVGATVAAYQFKKGK